MCITWLSTRSDLRMLNAPVPAELEAFLRQHAGVDSALLATSLNLPRRNIEAMQRKLGLRRIVHNGDYR